ERDREPELQVVHAKLSPDVDAGQVRVIAADEELPGGPHVAGRDITADHANGRADVDGPVERDALFLSAGGATGEQAEADVARVDEHVRVRKRARLVSDGQLI